MPAPKPKSTRKPIQSRSPDPAHHLGFEATLWATASEEELRHQQTGSRRMDDLPATLNRPRRELAFMENPRRYASNEA